MTSKIDACGDRRTRARARWTIVSMSQLVALAAWVAIAPATVGMAVAAPACEAALEYSAKHGGVAVLALKDGSPVCEGYTSGGAPDKAYELWSGTKSFNGIIAAAAVQDGLLALDEPVSKTIAEWRNDPQKSVVTIRQLLSLTSGLASKPGRAPD